MSASDYTVETWNTLVASHPSAKQTTEYVWMGASNNDTSLVREVLAYAKHNNYIIDITHAVHLSCVYAQHEMLQVLDHHQPLTPHHIMTGLYSAASGCQNTVLEYLLSKANVWGDDFYQYVEGEKLINVVCTPGNVSERRVLECIKILEPLLDPNTNVSLEVISLLNYGHPKAAQHLLPYSNEYDLRNVASDFQSPHIVDNLENLLLNHKLTAATQSNTTQNRVHKKM